MKLTTLLLIIVSSLLSCSKDDKCYTCTRTWEYHGYRMTTDGTKYDHTYTTNTHSFSVCSEDEKEAAEKTQTSFSNPSGINYIDGVGTCECN